CRTTHNINKYAEPGAIANNSRSVRPKKLSRGQLARLKRLVNNKTGIALRRLSSKFKVSLKTIGNYLNVMGIRYYENRSAPKYTDKQLEEIPTRVHRLLLKCYFKLNMDDEKYFTLYSKSVLSNRGFYTLDRSIVSPEKKI
ncbi:unnamed protein product, partial [Rotaria sordida]